MAFTKPLTWKCHICGEERPDANISVLTKPLVINGVAYGEQNIRYCNDRVGCIEGAKYKDFFEVPEPLPEEGVHNATKTNES